MRGKVILLLVTHPYKEKSSASYLVYDWTRFDHVTRLSGSFPFKGVKLQIGIFFS